MKRNPLRACVFKESIKLRKGWWFCPLLLFYAASDTFLTLRMWQLRYGSFGLWETVVFKQPQFFGKYVLVVLCGVAIGLLQAWPEFQGKRLRLFFHLSVSPGKLLAFLLGTGVVVLVVVNLVALALLVFSLAFFRFPREIVSPVFESVMPWSLLSFIAYFSVVAFLAASRVSLRLLVIVTFYALFRLLGAAGGYGVFSPSLWFYWIVVLCFVPLVYYVLLQFKGGLSENRLYAASRGIALALVSGSVVSLLLPLYWRLCMPTAPRHSMHFSPVYNGFVLSSSPAGRIGPDDMQRYTLENGTVLSREEYRSALPFLYVRDLVKWGIFPRKIAGLPVSASEAEASWQFMRLSSEDWNAPQPPLHMLLEANPEGARLQKPDDFFRVADTGHRIEFLVPVTGRVDQRKSDLFNRALLRAGFVFPVKALGGNPDVRKLYDSGYFLLDTRGTLFQLQMYDGKPVCRALSPGIGEPVRHIAVKEHESRKFFGFVVSDRSLYAIMQPEYELRRFPLPALRSDDVSFALWSDPLFTSVIVRRPETGPTGAEGYAVTPDFKLVHTFVRPPDAGFLKTYFSREILASFLFPVQITASVPGSAFRNVHVAYGENRYGVLAGIAFACLLLFVSDTIARRPRRWVNYVLVAFFGFAALLVVVLADMDESVAFFRFRFS